MVDVLYSCANADALLSVKKIYMLNAMKLHLATTLLNVTNTFWFQTKLKTSLMKPTTTLNQISCIHCALQNPSVYSQDCTETRKETINIIVTHSYKICGGMVSHSSNRLTLFEMNCWFLCDQGHVINRPPTMQISLPE